jgi:hypothetical protein
MTTTHTGLLAHDGYKLHSHEVRPDHDGVEQAAPPAPMSLDLPAQRDYCAALGLIAPGDWAGCYTDPQAREVTRLLAAMERQQGKINDAARWMRSAMDQVDTRFAGETIHQVSLNSCGEVARYAIDYDMAVAAYCALQDQLQQIVNRVRREQGHEVGSFARLEDHPAAPLDLYIDGLAAGER